MIFSLGTNTEIVPLDSQGFVNEFLAKINEYEDVASYVYTCGEMQNNDAKTLYYHAIPNLWKNIGVRPHEIHIKKIKQNQKFYKRNIKYLVKAYHK